MVSSCRLRIYQIKRSLYNIILAVFLYGLSLYAIIGIVLRQKYEKIHNIYVKVTYPYLQLENQKLLEYWEVSYFAKAFNDISMKMFKSSKARQTFNIIYVLLTYVIPLTQACALMNFAYFYGDLKLCIYILPFSLISWLFNNLFFYYFSFTELNFNALREYLLIHVMGKPLLIRKKMITFNSKTLNSPYQRKHSTTFRADTIRKVFLNLSPMKSSCLVKIYIILKLDRISFTS